MTTARSAAAKVFNIGELLEAILLDVPCKDVMLLQRVSRFWEATIAGSQNLREPLCFVPAEQSEEWAEEGNYRLRDYYKKFSAQDYHNFFSAQDEQGKAYTMERPRMNPLLEALCPEYGSCKSLFQYTYDVRGILADDRNGLLRKMPVIYPPFREVSVVVRHAPAGGGHVLRTVGVIKAEEGVTVGHLFDHLEKEVMQTDTLAYEYSCCGLICEGVSSYIY